MSRKDRTKARAGTKATEPPKPSRQFSQEDVDGWEQFARKLLDLLHRQRHDRAKDLARKFVWDHTGEHFEGGLYRKHAAWRDEAETYFGCKPDGTLANEILTGWFPSTAEVTGLLNGTQLVALNELLKAVAGFAFLGMTEGERRELQDKVYRAIADYLELRGERIRPLEKGDLPPLSPVAALWYDILLELPAHKGLTAPQVIDEIRKRDSMKLVAESTLRGRIKADLEPYGIENKRRIGYRIKPSKRPKK